jgi:holo-[acyl-carrier protein] synthase
MREMVLGHGIDIVDVSRIAGLVERHGQRFLDRCFTRYEQSHCATQPRRFHERLAGRFAAKEAALKALGTGLRHGIEWTDIELTSDPAGAPVLRLTGVAAGIAARRGIIRWSVSISHTSSAAIASVIAE